MKKGLAVFLCILLFSTACPRTSFAQGTADTTDITKEENVTEESPTVGDVVEETEEYPTDEVKEELTEENAADDATENETEENAADEATQNETDETVAEEVTVNDAEETLTDEATQNETDETVANEATADETEEIITEEVPAVELNQNGESTEKYLDADSGNTDDETEEESSIALQAEGENAGSAKYFYYFAAQFEDGAYFVEVGESQKLNILYYGTITFTSQDESIAIVSADGTVTGVGAGYTTIHAKMSGDENWLPAEAYISCEVNGGTQTLSEGVNRVNNFTEYTFTPERDGTYKISVDSVWTDLTLWDDDGNLYGNYDLTYEEDGSLLYYAVLSAGVTYTTSLYIYDLNRNEADITIELYPDSFPIKELKLGKNVIEPGYLYHFTAAAGTYYRTKTPDGMEVGMKFLGDKLEEIETHSDFFYKSKEQDYLLAVTLEEGHETVIVSVLQHVTLELGDNKVFSYGELYEFTPEKDGIYRIRTKNGGNPIVLGTDILNAAIDGCYDSYFARVPGPDGVNADAEWELQAGRTYYISTRDSKKEVLILNLEYLGTTSEESDSEPDEADEITVDKDAASSNAGSTGNLPESSSTVIQKVPVTGDESMTLRYLFISAIAFAGFMTAYRKRSSS